MYISLREEVSPSYETLIDLSSITRNGPVKAKFGLCDIQSQYMARHITHISRISRFLLHCLRATVDK